MGLKGCKYPFYEREKAEDKTKPFDFLSTVSI
jgi:hypothetical protein